MHGERCFLLVKDHLLLPWLTTEFRRVASAASLILSCDQLSKNTFVAVLQRRESRLSPVFRVWYQYRFTFYKITQTIRVSWILQIWKFKVSQNPIFSTMLGNYPKCRKWILQFWPIKSDLSGNTVWTQASGFQKLAKLTIFGISNELLFAHNVNVAHFARNLEWDFFCDFQTLWVG